MSGGEALTSRTAGSPGLKVIANVPVGSVNNAFKGE